MRSRRFITYAVILTLAIAAPFILSRPYLQHLLVMSCIFALLALSWNIIMGGMGQFNFGHAAFFGIGAYASAILSKSVGAEWAVWVGFLLAFFLAGGVGLLLGYVCLRRMRGMYLAIVTYGFGIVIWIIACSWYTLTRGTRGIIGVPAPQLFDVAIDSEISYYYFALALLLLAIWFLHGFWRSRMGRAIISLRENEKLASSTGINATRYYVVAFGLGTALAGLSGATYGHFVGIVTPDTLGMYYMLTTIIMVLVGGTGTMAGPVLGAAIFVFVPELLRATEMLRFVMFGAILLVFSIFMPQGIYPSLVSSWNRFIRYRRSKQRGKEDYGSNS